MRHLACILGEIKGPSLEEPGRFARLTGANVSCQRVPQSRLAPRIDFPSVLLAASYKLSMASYSYHLGFSAMDDIRPPCPIHHKCRTGLADLKWATSFERIEILHVISVR